MLTKKYKTGFLKLDKRNEGLKGTLKRIITKEEEYETPCINWNTEQVEEFLRDSHSVSPNAISRSLTFLRSLAEYICSEEKLVCPEFNLDFGRLYDLVDYNKLLNVTITYGDYRYLIEKLSKNIRDKVLFELAWLMLTNDEIRNLKKRDIEFETDPDTEMEIAWLMVSDTKMVKVEDPEVVKDIKKCREETYYYVSTKDGRDKMMKLKPTDYLIRAVQVGKPKMLKNPEEYIENPSLALHNTLIQQEIIRPGIEVSELSIENIKRSKMIYLLAPQNEKYFDNDLIMSMLDSGNIESNLSWFRKVAKIKYNQ